MNAVLNQTRDGIIQALTVKPGKPELLLDVYRAMKAAGDPEAERFLRTACKEFAVKLMATVGGAEWAMKCWTDKRAAHINDIRHANRLWFLGVLRDAKRLELTAA